MHRLCQHELYDCYILKIIEKFIAHQHAGRCSSLVLAKNVKKTDSFIALFPVFVSRAHRSRHHVLTYPAAPHSHATLPTDRLQTIKCVIYPTRPSAITYPTMPPNTLTYLVKSGHAAPSADNSQPWHFVWDGETLSITYDTERVQDLTFPPRSPATLLSIGGVIENISQLSDFLGIPIKLNLFPDDPRVPNCYARFSIPDIENNTRNTGQHPLFHRHTNRFSYRKEGIATDIVQILTGLSEGKSRIRVFNESGPIRGVTELIRTASEVRFQIREVHEWLEKSLRFTEEDVKKADGLDVRTLNLPPGGNLFLQFISEWDRIKILNKVGIYKLLAAIDSRPVSKAPAVVAIIGDTGDRGSMDAGRLLSRLWIQLNSHGIAVHPYYVVSDQLTRLQKNKVPEKLVGQVEEMNIKGNQLFDMGENETLHMLLRIGYPTCQPPRSLRLPLEKVFTDLTKPQSERELRGT